MKKFALLALMFLLPSAAAAAPSTTNGSSALALAGLVAAHSPLLTHKKKRVMDKLLRGRESFTFPAGKTITVTAKSVVCRSSNVDIAAHSCVLTFGAKHRNLIGRSAHELYATLIENGVPGDGAAGSNFEAVSDLSCVVDPNGVKQKDGSGASCAFTPGAP